MYDMSDRKSPDLGGGVRNPYSILYLRFDLSRELNLSTITITIIIIITRLLILYFLR
jgi:hypothetical protein